MRRRAHVICSPGSARRASSTPAAARTGAPGAGRPEHPTQAWLDGYTIRKHKGRLRGLKVAILGDLLHSRVLRSNVLLLTKLGANVWLCGAAMLRAPRI